jgi:hypothetical protein
LTPQSVRESPAATRAPPVIEIAGHPAVAPPPADTIHARMNAVNAQPSNESTEFGTHYFLYPPRPMHASPRHAE